VGSRRDEEGANEMTKDQWRAVGEFLLSIVGDALSKRVQRYFGNNEQRERHRGRLVSPTWKIVIWKRP